MKHQTYMEIARAIARESKCISHQVGAIIVKDGRIISTGYNGTVSGAVNCCDHAKDKGWIDTSFIHAGLTYTAPKGATSAYVHPKAKDLIYHKLSGSIDIVFVRGHWTKIEKSIWAETIKGIDPIWEQKKSYVLNQSFRQDHREWSSIHESHAETNCIAHSAKHGLSVDGGVMYVTLSPCIHCCKILAQSGITHVYYDKLYDMNSSDWDAVLKTAGIHVHKLD